MGWVELAEELGKPIHQRRLLLVTPQALALLDGPAPKLVRMTSVAVSIPPHPHSIHNHTYILTTIDRAAPGTPSST